MRKVSMVSSPDRKDAQPVKHRAYPDRPPSDPGPKGRNARQMHQHKRNGRRIHNIRMLAVDCGLRTAHGGQTLSRPLLFFATALDAAK